MKKSIIVICIIVIILIVGLLTFKAFSTNGNSLNYELEKVSEINYKLLKQNNKFGVINKNGEVVVSPIYDEIDIPNPSKSLFICMYDYNTENEQYSIKVLNDKSEQILYEYFIVEAIEINPTISEIPYEKSVLKYKQNGKYGLIDFEGNVIVKPKYEQIEALDGVEGLLLVKDKENYGVININGDTVIKEKYDSIQADSYLTNINLSELEKIGFIIGESDNGSFKYGYLNSKGEQILDIKYSQIQRIQNITENNDTYLVAFENDKVGFYKNSENIIKHEYEDIFYDENNNSLILQKDSKQGVSDLNGNIFIDIKYDNIFTSGKYINLINGANVEFYDNLTKQFLNLEKVIAVNETLNNNLAIVITNDEKHKIWDIQNNEIMDEEYDYLEYMYDDYFIAVNGSKYGIVNVSGKKVVNFKYDFIYQIPNTKIVECTIDKNNLTDLVCENNVIISMKNAQINMYDNYLNIQSDKESIYLDFEGNKLENTHFLNAELFAINQKGKWGFVNKNGEIVVKPEFDFVTEMNQFGFAGIKKDGKWGSINSSGKIVVEPSYEIDEWASVFFIGKYYEVDLGYGVPYFVCD